MFRASRSSFIDLTLTLSSLLLGNAVFAEISVSPTSVVLDRPESSQQLLASVATDCRTASALAKESSFLPERRL
jgi:hypothetical protein